MKKLRNFTKGALKAATAISSTLFSPKSLAQQLPETDLGGELRKQQKTEAPAGDQ